MEIDVENLWFADALGRLLTSRIKKPEIKNNILLFDTSELLNISEIVFDKYLATRLFIDTYTGLSEAEKVGLYLEPQVFYDQGEDRFVILPDKISGESIDIKIKKFLLNFLGQSDFVLVQNASFDLVETPPRMYPEYQHFKKLVLDPEKALQISNLLDMGSTLNFTARKFFHCVDLLFRFFIENVIIDLSDISDLSDNLFLGLGKDCTRLCEIIGYDLLYSDFERFEKKELLSCLKNILDFNVENYFSRPCNNVKTFKKDFPLSELLFQLASD